jgi:hypothetical protein
MYERSDGFMFHFAAGLYRTKGTTMQDGHIERRMAFRNAATKEEAEKELQKQKVGCLA